MSVFNSNTKEFPDGPVVKNLPSNGDEGAWGSIPGQGTQIPHPAGATKPTHGNRRAFALRGWRDAAKA